MLEVILSPREITPQSAWPQDNLVNHAYMSRVAADRKPDIDRTFVWNDNGGNVLSRGWTPGPVSRDRNDSVHHHHGFTSKAEKSER